MIQVSPLRLAGIFVLVVIAGSSLAGQSIGKVNGWVFDVKTRSYVAGASVEVIHAPGAVSSDWTSGTTSATGHYSFKAPLGSISSRFATERLFDLSIMSVLLGGAKKVSKFVNVTEVVVRVQKAGYKPFAGPARVRIADPESFQVWIETVYLVPEGEPGSSYASDLRDALGDVSFDVSPNPIKKGVPLTFAVRVSGLPLQPKEEPACDVSVHFRIDPDSFSRGDGKQVKGKAESGSWLFSGTTGLNVLEMSGPLNNNRRIPLADGIHCVQVSPGFTAPRQTPAFRQLRIVVVGDIGDSVLPLVSEANTILAKATPANTPRFKEIVSLLSSSFPDSEGLASATEWWALSVERDPNAAKVVKERVSRLLAKLGVPERAKRDAPAPSTEVVQAASLANDGRESEALDSLEKLFGHAEASKRRDFHGRLHYAKLLLNVDRRDQAKTMLALALRDARGEDEVLRDQTGTAVVAGTAYEYFQGPLLSGTVGYVYPEAAYVAQTLAYWGALDDPTTSPLMSSLLARSLAGMGARQTATKLISAVSVSDPIDQAVLAALAQAHGLIGNLQQREACLARLRTICPGHPMLQATK